MEIILWNERVEKKSIFEFERHNFESVEFIVWSKNRWDRDVRNETVEFYNRTSRVDAYNELDTRANSHRFNDPSRL